LSELDNVQHMLEAAESAANAGDLAAADDLLQRAARIQEAELGPLHPDLANTLNNLAVVAETTGRFEDAEKFYRRAVAIASASLPADSPMVASSRKNLEDFCRERGVPIDPSPIVAPPLERRPPEPVAVPREEPARSSRRLAAVAIGVGLLAFVAVFVVRSRGAHETPPPQAVQSSAPPDAKPVPPPSSPASTPPAAIERPQPQAKAVSLATSQLCRVFSTSGRNWRCTPVENPVTPGPIVFYTRVRSPHKVVVIHRWYRGDALRKTARLPVQASPTEGYRTYSRQTVHAGESWRVEARTADGELLDEQRLTVVGRRR
jgi:hypothetical protein